MASKFRPPAYINHDARAWRLATAKNDSKTGSGSYEFHKTFFPNYSPTPLVALSGKLANEVGIKAVYVKFEGQRLDLPSFKILGASWAVFKTLVSRANLSADQCNTIAALKEALASKFANALPDATDNSVSGPNNPVSSLPTLFAATDGNHGRAVARMGALLGLPVHIFVPEAITGHDAVVHSIRGEGAVVTSLALSYDETVISAFEAAEKLEPAGSGILVQDTSFPGYDDEVPSWIVEGYDTMLCEIDDQLHASGTQADVVFTPVGVGSFAQAVVSHYKAAERATATRVVTVEPDTAACLHAGLAEGALVTVNTQVPTIMTGLDCGTVSTNAWPILQAGIDGSMTVSDYEAHEACQMLMESGIAAGPCGAAPLAALRRLTTDEKLGLGMDHTSVIVLCCTEGHREYSTPRSVQHDDAVTLCQALVQINSSIPGAPGSANPGPGETEIARYITAWLQHRDIETHWLEPTKGRPSVIGVVKGTGGGKSLMLNGHMDTVTIASYEGDALTGHIKDGKLYGRGSADMKSGLAAILVAVAQAKQDKLPGDVIFTGVADEEDMSLGTEQVLAAGWRADAAVVCEPTLEDLIIAHKGFIWFEVDMHGLAAHGSRPDLGIDAISRAGYFLVELDKYAKRLLDPKISKHHPLLGPGSVHASIVRGGEEPASYPAKCTVTIERRTIAGETNDTVLAEMEALLRAAGENSGDPDGFRYDLRMTFSRNPFEIAKDHPLAKLVADQIGKVTAKDANLRAEAFWTDCALIADTGIPVVMYGPHGEGLHAKEEWVDVRSIEVVTATLIGVLRDFTAVPR